MTATLHPPSSDAAGTRLRSLPFLASTAGACAAGVTLVGCLVIAVCGWFLADGGIHGAPRDALRTGGTAWLLGHGSGVSVRGVTVTVLPLGITMLCALSAWHFGLRLGEQVAGHGPDASALADGERDWTVAMTTGLYSAAYVVIGVLTSVLAGTGAGADTGKVLLWCLVLSGVIGGVAISIGSGRAAVWLARAPAAVPSTLLLAWSILTGFLLVSLAFFVAALLLDFGAAMSVMSQLHLDLGDGLAFLIAMLALVPNAVIFAGSFLLGPGFLVGTGTLVSPSMVAIGPVPMLPLLAALPDNGPTPGWMPALLLVPVLCATGLVVRFQRRNPVVRWDEGALQGVVAGVVAGLALGLLAAVAGGAAGPGRMVDVGPPAGEVVFHAMVSLGLGGLLGGLIATWWNRRSLGLPQDG